jgi:kexin
LLNIYKIKKGNYDGYANNKFTIAIGAVGNDGKVAWYSEPCSALFAVAPSSGSTKRIVTTDLNGSRGESATDCNPSFGGTSAASPIVKIKKPIFFKIY